MADGIITLGNSGAMRGQIVWWSESYIETNSSYVHASLQVRKGSDYSGTTGAFSGSVVVNGNDNSGSYYGLVESDWVEVCSHSITVNHNSQGKASIYISGTIKGPSGTSLAGAECTGGETVALDDIPRSVSITSASDFTDEANPVIGYSNPAGTGANSLKAAILSEDGGTVYAPYRSVSRTGSSFTFNLTDTERAALRNATPNSSTIKVKFALVGTFGSTQLSSTAVRQMTIVNGYPTISASVLETNSAVSSLTGDASKMIRYVSNASVSMTAAALKGASIVSKKITCGSKVINDISGTFTGVESGDFVFEVSDSRGNTTKVTVQKTIVAYVLPTCNIAANAPDTAGNFVFKISGNYFNSGFGAANNTLQVQYRYKSTGDYSAWTTMTPVVSGNAYTASQNFSNLDYKTTYVFQARITDKIMTVTTEEKPMRSKPIFDWGANDFNINGDLNINGTLSINGLPLTVYDVGDIYITTRSDSPAAIFGGTWEQIQNRFLLAAGTSYTAGNTGGKKTVTLTQNQIPAHSHVMNSGPAKWNLKSSAVVSYGGETGFWPIGYDAAGSNDTFIQSTGGGAAHDNMPPYLVVYIWKRVA